MTSFPPNYAPPPEPGPDQPSTGYAAPPVGVPPGYGPTGHIPGYAPVGVAPMQVNSALAMASLILGILVFCTGLTGIPAVICGHLALTRINASEGHLKGRGLAIAGLIMGYIGVVLLIVAAVAQAGR